MTANLTHEFVDVVDMEPIPGEYAMVKEMFPVEVCGETIQAYSWEHAYRLVINRRWESKCECCNHRLRYCHITQDQNGGFHCFGRTCLDITALGEEGARRLAYSERIEQKRESGFYATFNVPEKFWDVPRGDRPAYARLWKGKAMSRGGRFRDDRPIWKLSVWGTTFGECLNNCVSLDRLLGVKLF